MGKTGTSQKNRDAWFIGCAKDYVVGVWVGRDDDKSMKNVFGSTLPLSIFKEIIEKFISLFSYKNRSSYIYYFP